MYQNCLGIGRSLLKNDDLQNQMGKNSNEMVQKFDWKNVAESIINEYRLINF